MEKAKNQTWAIIPARGGSKSIPLKNLAPLGGHPLMKYVINAAKSSKSIDRIISSTENEKIEDFCRTKGIEVHKRPAALCGDTTEIAEVIVDLINDYRQKEGAVPDFIAFLQPTSPFMLPEHIDICVESLKNDTSANSAQTITECPHVSHAYNQRVIEDGFVRWRFAAHRRGRSNKQSKPKHYIFGNLAVIRTEALLKQKEMFPKPSIPHIIPIQYALDIDGPWDFKVAESLLKCGEIKNETTENTEKKHRVHVEKTSVSS